MRFLLFLTAIFLFSGCDTSKVIEVPYADLVSKVKNKYGKKSNDTPNLTRASDRPRVSGDALEELRERIASVDINLSYIPIKRFDEQSDCVSFFLRERQKIPKWHQVTLKKMGKSQTEVKVHSENHNKGRFGCCCFLFFNMGQRNVSGERKVLREIEELASKEQHDQ